MKDFLDRTEIISVLNGFNPWWSGRPYSVPPFRRLAFEAGSRYLEDTTLKRAVLLSGPRRVGKTTVLQQTAQALVEKGHDPRSILYLSLDHPLLKLLSLRGILSLTSACTRAEFWPIRPAPRTWARPPPPSQTT